MDTRLQVPFVHRVRFVRDVFGPSCNTLREVLESSDGGGRAVMLIDDGLVRADPHLPQRARRYFDLINKRIQLIDIHLAAGGEDCKNDPAVLQRILQQIHDAGIDRKSYVIAVGGGALLDVVGYAATIAHRGVRLVRLPSTTLAQDDSGVGVKSGVNAFGKKNFLGAFAVPWAVINDLHLLRTLSDRDWISGFSEALKVAMIKDATLYQQLCRSADAIRRRDERVGFQVVQRSAQLHYEHIVNGGDPFEMNQARPLDFGHWAAHKLESMSGYELRHGEAVAIGLAIDITYAYLAGLIDRATQTQAVGCLVNMGFVLSCDHLDDAATLMQGLDEFREHLGGRLTITFPDGVGKAVDLHEIDRELMARAIAMVQSAPKGVLAR